MPLRAGDWVEIRSKEEILATLDKKGRLESMPFMPEMFAYCGKRMRVFKRAHKACDTINPIRKCSLTNTVLLSNIRCDGAAHGGCQAQCSVFWKEAWLKPLSGSETPIRAAERGAPATGAGCAEKDVLEATKSEDFSTGKVRYQCQATDFPSFSTPILSRQLDLYVKDYTSRNVTMKEFFQTACYFLFKAVGRPSHDADGGAYASLYDRVQRLRGGLPYPRRRGKLKDGEEHLVTSLALQPGELVRVKSYEEILATIDKDNKNRGLLFDAEMVPYCGGVFRVRSSIERFVDEKTGMIRTMKTPRSNT